MPALLRQLVIFAILLPTLLLARLAYAEPAPATARSAQPITASARLTLGIRTLFVFRAPLAGFPAQDRADGARKRLDKAIAAGGPQKTSVRTIAQGTQVLLDGRLLFLVTPADVNPLAGDTTDEVAADSARMLDQALLERREQGSPRYLLEAGAWCLAASVAYLFVLRGLGALHRRVRAWTQRSVSRRLEQIRFRNVALFDANHLVRFMRQVVGLLVWALRLFATFLWASFLLGHIPYFRSWGERLRDYLLATASTWPARSSAPCPGCWWWPRSPPWRALRC